ncbi:hypothetical protein ACLMJK_008130 [Lecanora helva]
MSVRGDRVVYRTDREVEYDSRSSAGRSLRPEPRDAPYTTRKVYRVPRDEEVEREDRLTVIGGNDHRSDRERSYSENRVVIRRDRTPEPEPERREIRVIEREREREPEIRRYERPVEREIRYERDYDRPPEREIRYERDFDRRDDLERYTRTVDYYPRPEPPPPIVIRQEPQQIIFQEAPRAPLVVPAPPKEEDFQLIQRSEIRQSEKSEVGSRHEDERQVARRPRPREDEEEDYYYERRVREVSRDDRSRHEDDRYSRREREREVSPGDSISQYGRDRDRHRGYESDDSYEYIRKETREDYSDGESPHHKRHLAEGAVAGLGAAELLRHHRKKTDGDGGNHRVGKDVGAAALGAIGAQAVSRARSHYREKSKSRRGSRNRDRSYSRSRSRSRSREGRRKHRRDKSRSRSRSKSRVKQLAGLGLGAAAVAAAVGYANRQNKKNQAEDRRSRSRVRRHSVGPTEAEEEDDARNPSHRNKKIAQAGLAGAAVAGLVERARSKSRGARDKSRGKSRSKSRIRTGIPIAAAGLGSAAIAGLYEKNQAKNKEKEARKEDRRERRERRSRSRSQSAPPYNDGARGVPPAIEYGDAPVGYGNNGGPDYYNRPASQQGFYNDQNAMVPAAAGGAAYGQQRDRERERSASESGSDGGRRRRRHRRRKSGSGSRSRSRGLATAAGAAGAAGLGGLAASEHEKRKQRRKEEKRERRRQQEAEQASYAQDPYAQQPYSPNSPQPAGYVADGQQQPYFPPPPGAPFTPPGANYPPEYQNQHAMPPNAQVHPDYGYPPQGGFQPPVPDAYSPPPGAAGYAPQQPSQPRRADENVSDDTPNVPSSDVPLYDSNGAPFYYEPNQGSGEGVNTPRAQSPSRPPLQRRATSQPPPATKSVKFNLSPTSSTGSGPDSPTQIRNRRERASSGSSKHSHHHHHDGGYDSEDSSRHNDRSQRHDEDRSKRRHCRASVDNPRARDHSPTSSDSTIDLPDRFDKRGRPIPNQRDDDDDPLAGKIQDLLSGKGGVGRFLQSLSGGGSGESEGGDGDGRRRRRRRRSRD